MSKAKGTPDMVGDVSFRRTSTDKQATNKQKCLVVCTRNVSSRNRHLMIDLQNLMPHARPHPKIEMRIDVGDQLQELAGLHRCNSVMYLEARKREAAFLWLAQAPDGPSVKLELLNVHTSSELRMAGNCLKFSRPLLHFDREFDNIPHLRIIKSLLVQGFNTPLYHPKSKPFVDHMLCFFHLDGKIWFRNYQLAPEKKIVDVEMMEVGPRFILNPIAVFDGCCRGAVLWRNPDAIAPSERRKSKKLRALDKMKANERIAEKSTRHRTENPAPAKSPLADVFA
jgi:ribosome biogenesis protein BRX1